MSPTKSRPQFDDVTFSQSHTAGDTTLDTPSESSLERRGVGHRLGRPGTERLTKTQSKAAVTQTSWRSRLEAAVESNWARLARHGSHQRCALSDRSVFVLDEAIHWLSTAPDMSVQAIVTDPPYGLVEYSRKQLQKKQNGQGGVWRIPPAFDGARRHPVPRFTVLSENDIAHLHDFFSAFAIEALRVLVPGGHLFLASNPLVSTVTFNSIQQSGFEKRGEIIRQVQTLRGGDRPKGSETEFADVSVMPRSCWEPWGLFRKPFLGTVAQNLRQWGAAGLRRISPEVPFKDVIKSSPTRGVEKKIAPHPSLKPQHFLRCIVRASLPLGIGVVYDPFAGSGSTLAAAEAVGYRSIGTDRDLDCFGLAQKAFKRLVALETRMK